MHKLTLFHLSTNTRFVEYGFTKNIRERIYHFALETMTDYRQSFQIEKCEKLPFTLDNLRKCYHKTREILWNQKSLF